MSIKLSQLKSEEIRTIIPCYFQDEHIGDVTIKNPTQDVVGKIKAHIKDNMVDDGLKIELLKDLTDLEVDCDIDDNFTKYYHDVFVSIMTEIDNIILEITMNYMLETYSFNKMSDDKKSAFRDIVKNQSEIIEHVIQTQEERNLKNEIAKRKAELKVIEEELMLKLSDSDGK